MSTPIVWILILGFIIGEISWSVYRALKVRKLMTDKRELIRFLSNALAFPQDVQFANLKPEIRKNPAADYLAACTEHGLQVDANTFSRFLSEGVGKAYHDLQATANTMPIIGLMGTFSGIIIGIMQINLESNEVSKALQPLINSAGLAFISSLCALICASILKLLANEWKKALDADIERTERNLLVHYLPQVSSNNTDEMFSRSVRRLEKTVRGFSTTFEKVTVDFIAQFKPLVEDQREINQKTSQHIDSVASKLEDNAKALKEVSDKQIEQVYLFSSVATRLSEASDSLQASMKLASDNLEGFVKLGDEMQQNISKMHEPLQVIVSCQKESAETLKNLYKNVESYDTNVQEYLKSLNAKLNMFNVVGNKVHEVRKDFEDFSKILNNILKQITEQAQDIHKDLRESFTLYDSNLRTLFTDVLENRRDIHMAYYDPDVIKNLDKACSENKALLDTMERHLHSLGTTTDKFIGVIEKLRGWGIYRVRREKEEKHRLGR
ncbi:MAG: toxic anion resistance protein [Candidatus Cloacimonetes bacterium]|jgi:biopolymer transport protein ExbB/TolQ|nr:toxic anion resistance protein [Candidatus Cloacimonadota bacterium]MCB5260110.1 toxic anion resistance protein [Candidatus Cloacimonadota bacterium]MDD3577499.1 toxic anion resistance protein [Candidatus Cloacimonadota bacterium]